MKTLTLQQKRAAVCEIKKSLEISHCEVTNTGTLFFVAWGHGCVQRDINYREFQNHGILIDILDWSCGYFSGSQAKAEALAEAFGGICRASEYSHYAESPCPIWTWESPNRHLLRPHHQHEPLVNLEEAKEILSLA